MEPFGQNHFWPNSFWKSSASFGAYSLVFLCSGEVLTSKVSVSTEQRLLTRNAIHSSHAFLSAQQNIGSTCSPFSPHTKNLTSCFLQMIVQFCLYYWKILICFWSVLCKVKSECLTKSLTSHCELWAWIQKCSKLHWFSTKLQVKNAVKCWSAFQPLMMSIGKCPSKQSKTIGCARFSKLLRLLWAIYAT